MKYIPVALLVIILLLPAITLLSLRKEIGLSRTIEGHVLFFYGDHDYRFSFISPKENLNSVVLKLKNISIRNTKTVYFNLLENQKSLRQIVINGSNIGDSSMTRFAFTEIKDSKDKKYTVILSSPETKQNQALGIHTDLSDHPVIMTYHIPSSKFQLVFDTYKNFITKIFSDPIFIAAWFILLGITAFVLRSINI